MLLGDVAHTNHTNNGSGCYQCTFLTVILLSLESIWKLFVNFSSEASPVLQGLYACFCIGDVLTKYQSSKPYSAAVAPLPSRKVVRSRCRQIFDKPHTESENIESMECGFLLLFYRG